MENTHTEQHFKKGIWQLNDQSNFNFQLNRVITWDGGELVEVREAGKRIHTSAD